MTDSTGRRPDRIADDSPLLHEFKNHLSVVVGFCDLLLRDLPEDDPKRADILSDGRILSEREVLAALGGGHRATATPTASDVEAFLPSHLSQHITGSLPSLD